MEKIWISGNSGSGKTTLADLIGKKFDIPVYHRDAISWDKDWNPIPEEKQNEIIKNFTKTDKWIYEGCRYTASKIDGRLVFCDTIIYLNINKFTCLFRGLRRYRKQLKSNTPKEDLQPITFKMIGYILHDFPKKYKERKGIFDFAKKNGKNVVILNGFRNVKRFIKTLN